MGAVGAKDWAGGFLDLREDLQGATFVGQEPLTSDVRGGYLGEHFAFLLGFCSYCYLFVCLYFWLERPESSSNLFSK